MVFLYAVPWPAQGLYSKKQIKKVGDLNGLKFRAYNSATIRIAELTGMAPTKIEAAEISQAFSTGAVESMITSPTTGKNSKIWENGVKYFYDIAAWFPKNMIIANKAAWNKLDKATQVKRENIADRGIWTAKKRYILNVWDSEGVRYSEPKLKIMGIEAVKSSTPAPCRKAIKDALKVMMSGTEDEMIDFIDQFRKKFRSLPPEEISFPRTVSDVVKYKGRNAIYEKGTPIHAR